VQLVAHRAGTRAGGRDAPEGLAITPDGFFAYVANSGRLSGTVSVIEIATNTVVATIPVGDLPIDVTITAAVEL